MVDRQRKASPQPRDEFTAPQERIQPQIVHAPAIDQWTGKAPKELPGNIMACPILAFSYSK